MRDFKEARLIDITIGNGTYGIAAPAVPKDNNKYTYLRITDINDDGSLNFSDLKSVDDPKANKYLLKPNDIVFARTGNSTGRSYFYDGSAGELVYAGFLIKFSLDSHKVNPKILKYYTHSKNYYDWVASFDSGATRGNINAKTFAEMPIILPPRNIQDKIVAILSALDEKIETNRKINARLEELAQAIFKSWFIDFEPFGGKMPEDWKRTNIGSLDLEISDFVANGSFASLKENVTLYDKPEFAYFIRNTDLKVNSFSVYVDEHSYNFLSKSRLFGGEIIISNVGDVGSVFLCPSLDKPMTLGNNIIMVRPQKDYLTSYLYLFFQSYIGQHLIDGITGGSAQPKFNKTDFKRSVILSPKEDTSISFELIVRPILKEMEFRMQESSRLAALRDTLLPKLMSGELIQE